MRIRSTSNRLFQKFVQLAVLTTPLFLSCALFAQAKAGNTISAQIREAVASIVAEEKLPGMIAAISDADGLIAIASAGVRKASSDVAITDNDLVHIGSCTKAMTSALVGGFVEEGVVTWETTLIDIFPEYRSKIHPDYHRVTLWQLVSHRAGLPANAKNWWVHRKMELKERRQTIMLENLKQASAGKAGEFLYSNLGYMIAGCMLEKINASTWETLIKKRIFDPLGSQSVGFGSPGTLKKTDQPWGHVKAKNQWQAKQFDNAEALGPAGRVHCTVADWAKFIALQLPGKPSIMDRKTLDRLIEPDKGKYAAGWSVSNRSWAKGTTFTHSGSNTMWYAVVWVAPELNRAFIVVTNSRDDKSAKICDKMIAKLIAINKNN